MVEFGRFVDSSIIGPSPDTHILHKVGKEAEEVRVMVTEQFLSSTNASVFIHGKLVNGRDVTIKASQTGYIFNEINGLKKLYTHGVHVPEPIALVDRDEEPRIGIVMGRVFGKDFSDVSSPENCFLLGREVRKANEIPVSGFGLIGDDGPQFQSANEHVESTIELMTHHIQADTKAFKLLIQLWGEVREDVDAQSPKFIHRDLKGRNVMVADSGEVILLDLEYWNGGDPLWDVGGFLFYVLRSGKPQSEFEDFLQGYTEGKEPTEKEKLRILFYTLLSAGSFVELVARADPENINYATEGLRKTTDFVRGKLEKTVSA